MEFKQKTKPEKEPPFSVKSWLKNPKLHSLFPHASLPTIILVAIFFILVVNIKYGDDIFFIPDENKHLDRSVGK